MSGCRPTQSVIPNITKSLNSAVKTIYRSATSFMLPQGNARNRSIWKKTQKNHQKDEQDKNTVFKKLIRDRQVQTAGFPVSAELSSLLIMKNRWGITRFKGSFALQQSPDSRRRFTSSDISRFVLLRSFRSLRFSSVYPERAQLSLH